MIQIEKTGKTVLYRIILMTKKKTAKNLTTFSTQECYMRVITALRTIFVAPNGDDDRYTRHMDKIKPSLTVVPVGAGNKHGHPHRIAMNIYKDKSKYERVYTTKDDKSMYVAFKSDGSWEYKKDLDYEDLIVINIQMKKIQVLKVRLPH